MWKVTNALGQEKVWYEGELIDKLKNILNNDVCMLEVPCSNYPDCQNCKYFNMDTAILNAKLLIQENER